MTDKTEIELLKERADDLGIKYSPNIGLETLRDKVNAKLAPEVKAQKAELSQEERYSALRMDATKLLRIRVSPLNPSLKESRGEWVRGGNRVVPTMTRFVPFDVDTHVESMLVNHLKSREYCVVVHDKAKDGKVFPKRVMRKAFQIEMLPALTEKELSDLASDQSKRQSVG